MRKRNFALYFFFLTNYEDARRFFFFFIFCSQKSIIIVWGNKRVKKKLWLWAFHDDLFFPYRNQFRLLFNKIQMNTVFQLDIVDSLYRFVAIFILVYWWKPFKYTPTISQLWNENTETLFNAISPPSTRYIGLCIFTVHSIHILKKNYLRVRFIRYVMPCAIAYFYTVWEKTKLMFQEGKPKNMQNRSTTTDWVRKIEILFVKRCAQIHTHTHTYFFSRLNRRSVNFISVWTHQECSYFISFLYQRNSVSLVFYFFLPSIFPMDIGRTVFFFVAVVFDYETRMKITIMKSITFTPTL